MKVYAVAFIDYSPDSDEFPNTHPELFPSLEVAKQFVEWDIRNLNEVYADEPERDVTWSGNDAIVRQSDNQISKYRICEIDADNRTALPFK